MSREEAEQFALQMNAHLYRDSRNAHLRKPYFETSSKSGLNIEEVFEFIFAALLGGHADAAGAARRAGRGVDLDRQASKSSKGGCC